MNHKLSERWFLLLLLPLCLAGPMLTPGGARADAVDEFVQAQLQKQHVPGLALGVVQNGKFVKEKGYGLADVERNVPVTTGTVFEIGSVTKQFTATAIMMLVDQGKIGLDDKISRYREGLPAAWQAVTIRQLLSHTSGIPDYEAIMGYGSYRNVMTANQVIALAAGKPMDFAPGTRWNYSNTGYFLLTLALEKITNQPYIQFVQAHILRPLGMTHTRSSEPRDIITGRAAGYAFEEGRLENRDPIQPTATGGAAMLVSTLGDMAKWGAELLAPTLLREKDYALLWGDTPLADGTLSGYGFGWFVSPRHGHRALEHSGGTAGFTCEMLCLPDDRLVVLVLTNGYQSTARPATIMNYCAALFVPALAYRPIPDRQPQVAAALKDFYTHRTDPDAYAAPLSPAFALSLQPSWAQRRPLFQPLGPVQSVELVEQIGSAAKPQRRYRMRYRNTTLLVLVTLDADSKIADLQAEEE
jgi:D-alanyl-D-alanine carboxypeptidase